VTRTKPPPLTANDVRAELQLEGLRSVVTGGFLALGQSSARVEALLERIATAIEDQTKLLTRSNGHARHDHHTD
jgi:hypothetical protein